YSMINLVNQLEKNLDPQMFSDEQTNLYLAKARFMRAFAYFNLANWFGPVPIRLTPSANQDDNHVAAFPVLDVYQQVERDYLFAVAHRLDAKNPDCDPGEPSRRAAHGMLARLCLRMGGLQPYLAENEADSYFDNPGQYFEKARQQC